MNRYAHQYAVVANSAKAEDSYKGSPSSSYKNFGCCGDLVPRPWGYGSSSCKTSCHTDSDRVAEPITLFQIGIKVFSRQNDPLLGIARSRSRPNGFNCLSTYIMCNAITVRAIIEGAVPEKYNKSDFEAARRVQVRTCSRSPKIRLQATIPDMVKKKDERKLPISLVKLPQQFKDF